MLGRAEPHGAIARLLVSRNGTAPAGPAADASGKRLRRLGRRSDRLAETLGEDHDLALLAERVRAAGRGRRRDGRVLGRRSRKALLQAIRRRRRRLRRRALRDGDRVYRSPPKRLLRDVRSAQAAWAAPLS
jgi:hypothetical protein